MSDTGVPPYPQPFGKAVANVYRGIKQDFAGKSDIDPQVREQVNADLDKLTEQNDAKKY